MGTNEGDCRVVVVGAGAAYYLSFLLPSRVPQSINI